MKLSRTVSYALQAALQLADAPSDAPIPCSHLAQEGGMPERFLLQILRNLVTKGILRSTRGVDGGYRLVRPPQEVTLLELIEAIEGPLDSADVVSDSLPETTRNRMKDVLTSVNQSIRNQLAGVSLAQLKSV